MVEIRAMKEGDRGHVRALELFCIREYLEDTLKKNMDQMQQSLVDQLGASAKGSYDFYLDQGLSFVAVENKQIVGFVFAQMVQYMNNVDKVLWVEDMGVHPDHRRKGIGLKLLAKATAEGKKKGAKAAESAIPSAQLASLMMHRKAGFFLDSRKLALLDMQDE
jgi:aminoglycoside 6'-N-acetyltransferase I